MRSSPKAARCAALVALVALLASLLAVTGVDAEMRRESLTLVTAKGERLINIEVAETSEEKSLGLMFRTSLADDAGMLFPYAPAQEIQMWMRNTYIPLDMVFIRADGVIHRIEVRTEPLSERVISSDGLVAGVLELAGGNAERLGLRPGDRVVHPHFKGKPKGR
ncbi:MAG TPA: DUF192 domain-containing protein [Hyphomicrobiaceae bacterium]|nr:DUF192 domain-containing protein [Hyphomicrobiaceae bacterium]